MIMVVRALPLILSSGLQDLFPKGEGCFLLCMIMPCCLNLRLFGPEDVGAWPYSVGLQVKWIAFLGTLHWLADRADLGVGGVSYVEMRVRADAKTRRLCQQGE